MSDDNKPENEVNSQINQVQETSPPAAACAAASEHTVSLQGIINSEKKIKAGTTIANLLKEFTSDVSKFEFTDATTGNKLSTASKVQLKSDMKINVTQKSAGS